MKAGRGRRTSAPRQRQGWVSRPGERPLTSTMGPAGEPEMDGRPRRVDPGPTEKTSAGRGAEPFSRLSREQRPLEDCGGAAPGRARSSARLLWRKRRGRAAGSGRLCMLALNKNPERTRPTFLFLF
ncbi:uncharacterized protein [Gorilla gorilla gorilla]|uniref:uncharacterized protein n=1 Tax=Gorilla gorilla gorilla TaxID=9595 RepID=UPI00300AE850